MHEIGALVWLSQGTQGQQVGINTSHLQQWLQTNAVPVLLSLIGLALLLASVRSHSSKVVTTIALTFMSLAVVALAANGKAPAAGSFMLSLIGLG